MKAQATKTWTTEQLIDLSNALGDGYVPGVNRAKATRGDRWTARRHIQASMMLGQVYL